MEANSAAIGLEWRRNFERLALNDREDVLRKALVCHLKNAAIKSYAISRDPLLAIALNDDLVQRNVIDAVEWFLYAEEPVQGRLKLCQLSNPPTLCGKVFKNNEPTYSCRDCALDATCVLCMACFLKSIHKDHNYRLNTSSGSGCCDCGDEEAWKQGASCEIHSVKSEDSADEDLLKKLPKDLLERAECLITILLDYCVDVICDPNEEKLLGDLPSNQNENTHAAMLYNDESHTFQGVITALQKSIPICTTKMGSDFASVVDREGRSSIFVGSLQSCTGVSTSVMKYTDGFAGPLRCEPTNIYTIACQLMALKLMKWLSNLADESDCMRRLHSRVCTTSRHDHFSHLARVFQADGKLWKVARLQNHQLFMNTLLKDSFGKTTLAVEFTKNYPIIMNDFYDDDQEHNISAAAMSVQLFTVPSLIQMLAVNYDLMETVIGVLLDKTRSYLGDDGVVNLSQDERHKSRRLYWVIHDLRYIVQNKPSQWNESLKTKFYRFLKLFLEMFRRFQGMNAMKRATGVHVEIEQEWRRDYNFQMCLTGLVPYIIQWCQSDRDILVKSIALTLECLNDIKKSTGPTKLKKYPEGKKSMKVFDFDVSSEKVSIHIPIVRFLSGLIGCCDNHFINIRDVLEIKKDEDALAYMEYPLKVLVFAAQVKAGMWKKNGYSVQQVYLYRKSNSATEMFDRDIYLLQVLSSCMDKDYFLNVVLDMFKLTSWASSSSDFEKVDESTASQQLSLANEFLHFLIIILGERYNTVVGQVTRESEVRREIIHRLCLGDMSRSELMWGLPLSESEYQRRTNIDEVIASVATFKKPGLSSKGMYRLSKECLDEFNPFFYHYDNHEQSKAEDQQRKRRKEEEISLVFAPPVPVEFQPTYSRIVELLTSKKMLDILTVLLWRVKHSNPKSWTDRIFHKVLHLIGLALHEEARQRNMGGSFGFVSAAKKRNQNVSKHYSLIICLEALQGNPLAQAHSQLLAWVIQKFNEERSAQSDFDSHPSDIPMTTKSSQPMDVSESKSHDQEKAQRQRLAQERRERILLQMSNMQKAFIRENSELYLSTNTELNDSGVDESDSAVTSSSEQAVIAIGNNRSPSVTLPREQFICILCQENPSSNERPLVYCAYVQRSTLLSDDHSRTVDEGENADPLVSCRDHRVGSHVGTCGHVMHGDCWQRFFESILAHDRASLRFRMRNTFDLTKREFLCPLCSGLGNTVLPIVCCNVTREERSKSHYDSWLVTFQKIESKVTKDLIAFSQSQDERVGLLKTWTELKKKYLPFLNWTELSTDMQSMITVFIRSTYTFGLNVQPDDEDKRVPLMVWSTCSYTIQCFEHSSRGESGGIITKSSKRDVDILRSLVFLANSMSSISKSRDVVSHCLRLISVLGGSELPTEERSMMDIDLFDWMIKMRFSLPSIDCQNDGAQEDGLSSVELDGFVFHLAVAASIVQILLTTPEDIPSDEMDDCDETESNAAGEMANLWKKLRHLCNPAVQTSSHLNPQRLLAHVKSRLLPFLRCCAIFFHMLNSTQVPFALRENFVSFDKEYDALAEYLALPGNLTEVLGWSDSQYTFTDEIVSKIVKRWCSNVNIVDCSKNVTSSVLMQKSLIKLPHDYSELISQASQYDCPLFSGDEHRVPAKCLICGEWLCCEAWCCKQTIAGQSVGSCTAHAQTCGAGIGIFLRVDCVILLLNGIGKGCYYPSPFLDAYGETDPDLKRGNPMYLCEERYERLQKLWKKHGIASEVIRQLETHRHFMSEDWSNY